MKSTLGEHIRSLEGQRSTLGARIMRESNKATCNQLERELRAVESALAIYRSALKAEIRAEKH